MTAARALIAFRDGEKGPRALAGAVLIADAISNLRDVGALARGLASGGKRKR